MHMQSASQSPLCSAYLLLILFLLGCLPLPAGTPTPLRSPRSSLVSSPSSCDCPLLLGRFSSTGSEGGYGRSPAHAAGGSSSQGCSLTTTPSPGKAAAMSGLGVTVSSSVNGCAAAASPAVQESLMLKMTPSVRTAPHRHRQHKPGCRFHPQQQQQQASGQGQQLPLQQLPSSPSLNGLMPQSSLRTALQQLESMASIKAARIMDRLNAGLQRMTSHRVFDGVLRQGTVGKEVSSILGRALTLFGNLLYKGNGTDAFNQQMQRLQFLSVQVVVQGAACHTPRGLVRMLIMRSRLLGFCQLALLPVLRLAWCCLCPCAAAAPRLPQVMRDWELGPSLGTGASCVTRLVTEKNSGRTAACKSISKQGILHSPAVKAALLAVQREVAILQVR